MNEQHVFRTAELDAAERMRRMAGFDLGLELREWLIHTDVGELGSILASWAQDAAADSDIDERLRRNGLRIFRVPMDGLDELEERLRPVGHRQRGWRGQVVRWDPFVAQRLRPDQRAVVIDGRVRRFNREEFALMVRSWVVQMEDGPRMLLQIVPTYQEPDVGRYRRMLGHNEQQGRALSLLHVELLVKPDEAIIVTSEAPGVTWEQIEPGAEVEGQDDPNGLINAVEDTREHAEDETDHKAHVDRRAFRRDRQRDRDRDDETMGPIADMPMTVGELLFEQQLSSPAIRGRGLIIFVPHVTEELMPPERDDAPDRNDGPAGR